MRSRSRAFVLCRQLAKSGNLETIAAIGRNIHVQDLFVAALPGAFGVAAIESIGTK